MAFPLNKSLIFILFHPEIFNNGTIFVVILLDLFGNVPTNMRLLSQIRYLTPITILLNTDVPDMRLTKVFGTYLISFQMGPLLYFLCGIILVIVSFLVFYERYEGKRYKREIF